MRLRRIALAVCTLSFATTSLTAQRVATAQQLVSSDKIHAHVTRLIDERGPSKVWVFFKDKGIADAEHLRREVDRAIQTMHPRTLKRRLDRRQAAELADVRDVPVQPRYVQAALATGVDIAVESSWLNAISVRASMRQIERIAALPFVDRIEPVRRGVLLDMPAAGSTPPSHSAPRAAGFYGISDGQLRQIGLPGLHAAGYTGKGVIIGILDTGFLRTHEAFNQPGHVVDVIAEWDFINNDGNTANEGSDDPGQHDHGTWILGTIGAYLPNELMGAAYDASFILCKTEDITNEYQQEEDFYVAGLQYIEANGGDVVTSSLGYIDWYTQSDLDGLTATTTIAVNVATSNGIFYATAAGNSSHDADPLTSALIAPADAFQVITCGAVDPAGTIAYFSSDGPTDDGRVKPELLARGYYTETVCTYDDTDCTSSLAGTSLSTPLIAGALACIAQLRPNWTVTTMRKNLFASGNYFRANGTFDPDFVLGYGLPVAWRAAKLKVSAQIQGPPPTLMNR